MITTDLIQPGVIAYVNACFSAGTKYVLGPHDMDKIYIFCKPFVTGTFCALIGSNIPDL